MKHHVKTEARLVEDLIDASRTRTGQLLMDKQSSRRRCEASCRRPSPPCCRMRRPSRVAFLSRRWMAPASWRYLPTRDIAPEDGEIDEILQRPS